MRQVTINITLVTDDEKGIKKALRIEAARRGITMSELARHALVLGATQILETTTEKPKDDKHGAH